MFIICPYLEFPYCVIISLLAGGHFYWIKMLSKVVRSFSNAMKPAVKVAVTGGSGNISYSMLYRIASGGLFGPNQPIKLGILDLPQMQGALTGVVMELDDCAFPLLESIEASDQMEHAFGGADYIFLVGSRPRGPGMERADLLKANGEIFKPVGQAIDAFANRDVKTVIVGNPANTNGLICMTHAKGIPRENFSAMTRLDQNRAMSQIAAKTGAHVNDVDKLPIWGNHSSTMYPDINSTTVKGQAVSGLVDDAWVKGEFLQTV